jgi:hypothetical protein
VGVFVGVGVGVHAGVVAADAAPPLRMRANAVMAMTTAARISPLAMESPIGRRLRMVTRPPPLLRSRAGWLVALDRHILDYLQTRGRLKPSVRRLDDGIADPVQLCPFPFYQDRPVL